MNILNHGSMRLFAAVVTLAISCLLPSASVLAADIADDVAFPEKFMLRLSYYNIDRADTRISVFSNEGLGAAYSFANDLGGDDSATVPRIDMYYRFNERHRIEFTTFTLNRDGSQVLKLEVDLGDETFSIGETLNSKIEYDLYGLGYSYSFFHSDRVELGISVGLNVTQYDFKFTTKDGSQRSEGDATAPLPMFGLSMGYAITPNWSLHYVTEAFLIEVDDAYRGSFVNSEVNFQYRFLDNYHVGAGFTHVSTDLEADSRDWKGGITDSHRGYLLFAGFQF
ncbi:MAG: DUF481 domain-containing protein [Gammaproteobacteria bacterium]|nr:DUF481 domain-containing protein [Gammaproteobacteria bacterium]